MIMRSFCLFPECLFHYGYHGITAEFYPLAISFPEQSSPKDGVGVALILHDRYVYPF